MGMTPTQRTLKQLRSLGYSCGIVERFNKFIGPHGIRQDLFGIIDIIAIKTGETLGVQSCGSAFSEHDKTIFKSENTIKWLQAGNRLELWGWRKIKKERGGKKMIWSPRVRKYEITDFIPAGNSGNVILNQEKKSNIRYIKR
jgi:hypothetical protein